MAIITTSNIRKTYGNIVAINDVSISVEEGEILALVGDNGAGKSTFIKMLSGIESPTSGTIYFGGEEFDISTYDEAREAGIETVYQDLGLVTKQSVAANVFLGKELVGDGYLSKTVGLVDESRMKAEANRLLDRIGFSVDVTERVDNLSGGQQQAIAIARALQSDPEILILDEPTSALSIEGVRRVHDVIRELNEQGLTILIISHNIDEILSLADRIAVLAQGEHMGTVAAGGISRDEIVSMMLGERRNDKEDTPDDSLQGAA